MKNNLKFEKKNIASKTKNDTDRCKFQLINNKAPNHAENSDYRIKTHLLDFYCCNSGGSTTNCNKRSSNELDEFVQLAV